MSQVSGSMMSPKCPANAAVSMETEAGRLTRLAAEGDHAAQSQLLGSLQDDLFRFSRSILGDDDQARDATQETALRILQGLRTFEQRSQLRTWALGIALNVCREIRRNHARPMKMRLQVHEEATLPTPHQSLEHAEEQRTLHRLVMQLSDRQREVILLRYFEDLSIEQTARAMACATGTVKATASQALRALAQRWSQPS